jgi:hypothetical protein
MAMWGRLQTGSDYRKEFGARIKKDKEGVMKELAARLTKKYKSMKRNIANI